MIILWTLVLCVLVMVFCLFFVNGVETLSDQIGLSQSAAGTVLLSLGTATPETLVPLIAILFVGAGGEAGSEIGIGAILGAPFLLSTVALGVIGVTATIQVLKGTRTEPYLDLEPQILSNFKYFFVFFPLAIVAALLGIKMLNYALGVFLLLGYAFFVWQCFRQPQGTPEPASETISATVEDADGDVMAAEAEEKEEEGGLWFAKILRLKETPVWLSVVQLLFGVVTMAYTIKIFAEQLNLLSEVFGISAAVISLIVAPLATELPEVGGASIFLTAKRKDTMALGNITGAMVYQSSIAVCIGLFLTDWRLNTDVAASIVLALISSAIIFAFYLKTKKMSSWVLLLGCLFYIAYLIFMASTGFA